MPPLRILHVTPYYEDAWGYGGIPRVAATLCRALAARGQQVTVVTTDVVDRQRRLDRGRAGRFEPWRTSGQGGVDVRVFPNLSNRVAFERQFFTPVGLGRFLRENARRFDVAHLHGFHHLPGVLAARELARAEVPFVLAPNGTVPRTEGRRTAKWIFHHTLGRSVLAGAARVAPVTRTEQRQLEALGVARGHCQVIPNPLEPSLIEPPSERPWRPIAGPFRRTIVYLGTLLPRKGVDVLVRALALLDDEVGLVIAGNDMGAAARVRRIVRRRGLQRRVRFSGLQVGPSRLELLAAADVVAYPGRAEIFGLVPLEALLCGAPVVVANDSGCGEVIGEIGGGLAVPPDDPAALAAALSTILSAEDHWRREAGQAAERVRRRFGADGVAGAFEDLYREMLDERSAARTASRSA